jgi:hypothetical protein
VTSLPRQSPPRNATEQESTPTDPGAPDLLARRYKLLERLDEARKAEYRSRVNRDQAAIAEAEYAVAEARGALIEFDHQNGCLLSYLLRAAISETPNALLHGFEQIPLVIALREELAETRAENKELKAQVANLRNELREVADAVVALESERGAAA